MQAMKYLVILSSLVGIVLIYLLSSASANSGLFMHNYYGLLAVAGGLALLLTLLAGFQVWQLASKIRSRVFGAKLTMRLALFFSLIAILPGVLVYAVSVQFLEKSIESWFDVRVEKALEGSLNLGRGALEDSLAELSKKGRFVALLLSQKSPAEYSPTLKLLVDEGATRQVAMFNRNGRLLAFATSLPGNEPDMPDASMIRDTLKSGVYSFVDAENDKRLELRVLVVLASPRLAPGDARILQFTEPVPRQVSRDEETVQSVYDDYRQRMLSRVGLKRLYGITLTLSLLIVLLSAVSAAIFISNRMSAPLAALAEGTRAVAQGDFSRLNPIRNSDELGLLTVLFNNMTSQLSEAKDMSEHRQQEVENARIYLESILGNLSSGVLATDGQFRLRSTNAAAAQILGEPLADTVGSSLPEISAKHPLLRTFVQAIMQGFAESGGAEWQHQFERMGRNGPQVLLLRGTRLSAGLEQGAVIVFDDITHLLQAERQAAWGEVARRLAHEIKNPLTPIQLSAERLQHKLSEKLDEQDAQMLQRATRTIVSQVTALKNMVVEFADYARAPSPKMTPVDMHQLLQEVLGLYEAANIPVILHLEAGQTRVTGDATRLRQVVHNLLQNAQDALQDATAPEIVIGSASAAGMLQVWVQDNGHGFPENLLARAFDPYVTTKLKGTGLGLAIVKKIVEEHGGAIEIQNMAPGGTRVSFTLPLLTEET
ncbi:MAG TPA: ATP-binding protein [Gallionellaceae bacterium]|nr:ATP-binding protein [Gallionellaceae bacterium]